MRKDINILHRTECGEVTKRLLFFLNREIALACALTFVRQSAEGKVRLELSFDRVVRLDASILRRRNISLVNLVLAIGALNLMSSLSLVSQPKFGRVE